MGEVIVGVTFGLLVGEKEMEAVGEGEEVKDSEMEGLGEKVGVWVEVFVEEAVLVGDGDDKEMEAKFDFDEVR